MPDVSALNLDQVREREATIISHVVALIHARRKGDYLTATDAHQELKRLGVRVLFAKRGKGGSDAR